MRLLGMLCALTSWTACAHRLPQDPDPFAGAPHAEQQPQESAALTITQEQGPSPSIEQTGNTNSAQGSAGSTTVTEAATQPSVSCEVKKSIRKAFHDRMPDFNLCFEKAVSTSHRDASINPSGWLTIELVIGPSRSVIALTVTRNSIHSPELLECVTSIVRQMQFSIPKTDKPITVTYPFHWHHIGM